jgi:hypothetical protein
MSSVRKRKRDPDQFPWRIPKDLDLRGAKRTANGRIDASGGFWRYHVNAGSDGGGTCECGRVWPHGIATSEHNARVHCTTSELHKKMTPWLIRSVEKGMTAFFSRVVPKPDDCGAKSATAVSAAAALLGGGEGGVAGASAGGSTLAPGARADAAPDIPRLGVDGSSMDYAPVVEAEAEAGVAEEQVAAVSWPCRGVDVTLYFSLPFADAFPFAMPGLPWIAGSDGTLRSRDCCGLVHEAGSPCGTCSAVVKSQRFLDLVSRVNAPFISSSAVNHSHLGHAHLVERLKRKRAGLLLLRLKGYVSAKKVRCPQGFGCPPTWCPTLFAAAPPKLPPLLP